MLRFANEYPNAAILQQAVAKLPWGHNILLIEKLKDKEIRLWYVQQCIENQWSRDVLDFQIKSQLHQRKGKAISNFRNFYLTFPSLLSIRQTASAESEHSILRTTFSKLLPNTCPIYPPKKSQLPKLNVKSYSLSNNLKMKDNFIRIRYYIKLALGIRSAKVNSLTGKWPKLHQATSVLRKADARCAYPKN